MDERYERANQDPMFRPLGRVGAAIGGGQILGESLVGESLGPRTTMARKYDSPDMPAPGSSVAADPQVVSELKGVGHALEIQATLLAELVVRCRPIVAPVPEGAASGSEARNRAAISPLSEAIRGHAERIHQHNAAIEGLLRSLEI